MCVCFIFLSYKQEAFKRNNNIEATSSLTAVRTCLPAWNYLGKMLVKACGGQSVPPDPSQAGPLQQFVLPLSVSLSTLFLLSHVNESLICTALIDNHGNRGRPNEAEAQVKICLNAGATQTINSLN